MSLLTHILNQEAEIITTSTDKYGDQKLETQATVPCRFRYITGVEKNVNQEAINSEAMIWFEPDVAIVESNIIFADSYYWRIDKLIKARRFAEGIVFLKAFVTRHELSDNLS